MQKKFLEIRADHISHLSVITWYHPPGGLKEMKTKKSFRHLLKDSLEDGSWNNLNEEKLTS